MVGLKHRQGGVLVLAVGRSWRICCYRLYYLLEDWPSRVGKKGKEQGDRCKDPGCRVET